MFYQNNNKTTMIKLSIIEDILKGKEHGNLSKIYKVYKALKQKENFDTLSHKDKGKFLGLKIFFEASYKETGTFEGHEVINKTSEKEMLKMLKLLCAYQQTHKETIPYIEDISELDLKENVELEYVKTLVEADDKETAIENFMELKNAITSNELKFVLDMFNFIHSMISAKQYCGMLKEYEQIIFPYYYLEEEYAKGYQQLNSEYREVLRRLYEYRLKQTLGIENIHVDIFMSENHRLMCMITKKNEKDKKINIYK